MCGIVAALLKEGENVAPILLESLTTLQHRGQDAAGIATNNGTQTHIHKSNGLVEDVFKEAESFQRLLGSAGIGHVRYPTAGSSNRDEAQPFYTNSPFGVALGHNGNLTNVHELRTHCRKVCRRQINTGSDSELLLCIFSWELAKLEDERYDLHMKEHDGDSSTFDITPSVNSVFGAVSRCMELCRGAYAAVVLVNGLGIVGFRDPNGIRPLCFGSRQSSDSGVTEYVIASESVVVDISGFSLIRDVNPGEAIIVQSSNHELFTRQCIPEAQTSLAPCIFEFVYFARADSCLDGASVYEARVFMGDRLGKRIQMLHPDTKIDVVVPVPATSRISAAQCAITLGVPYMEGLVRNRYTQRTFIMPGQTQRKKSIRLKLNPVPSVIRGKSVLIVDDSVVRGTTSRHIVEIVKAAGAAHVYFASAAPAIRHPNVYGIDMPTREELIAFQRSEEEIAAYIGVEWIVYQSNADLKNAVRAANPKLSRFDMSCFDGIYVAGQLDEDYFKQLHDERNDSAKASSLKTPSSAKLLIPSVTSSNGNGLYSSQDSASSSSVASKNGKATSNAVIVDGVDQLTATLNNTNLSSTNQQAQSSSGTGAGTTPSKRQASNDKRFPKDPKMIRNTPSSSSIADF